MKSRQALQRRFKSLVAGEAVSAIILPVAAFRIAGTSGVSRVPLLVSAVALSLFLLAAAVFWLQKARGAFTSSPPPLIAGIMAFTLVLALIGFGLTARATGWGMGMREAIVAGALQLMVLAEWVNYRWVQIAGGGWRSWLSGHPVTPVLARDLRRSRVEQDH